MLCFSLFLWVPLLLQTVELVRETKHNTLSGMRGNRISGRWRIIQLDDIIHSKLTFYWRVLRCVISTWFTVHE